MFRVSISVSLVCPACGKTTGRKTRSVDYAQDVGRFHVLRRERAQFVVTVDDRVITRLFGQMAQCEQRDDDAEGVRSHRVVIAVQVPADMDSPKVGRSHIEATIGQREEIPEAAVVGMAKAPRPVVHNRLTLQYVATAV